MKTPATGGFGPVHGGVRLGILSEVLDIVMDQTGSLCDITEGYDFHFACGIYVVIVFSKE